MTAPPAVFDAAGLPSRDRALDLAEHALGFADGVPVQVTVTAARRRVTRIGNGVVLHHADISDVRVMLRAVAGGAEGVAFTNDLSDAGIRDARDRAVASARVQAPDPAAPGLPDEATAGLPVAVDPWDPATAEGDLDGETRGIGDALDAARRHDAVLAGVIVRNARVRAIASSTGLRRADRATEAMARLIATRAGASGHGGALAGKASEVDLGRLGEKAAATAAAGVDAAPLAPGRYDVVLEPEAVIELLEWLSMIAFGSQPWEDGTSFLKGREGQRVTGERVTLRDPGPAAEILPIAFDHEGVARRPVAFVEAGVARAPVHDRASGRRSGCASTGHWVREERFPSAGAVPGAVVMAPGSDAGPLVAQLRHGLHVHRFHYVNGFLDPPRARMTGLTRDGLFEVRDGEPVRAVRDLRFTEDVLEALGRIDGLGAALRSVGTFWSDMSGAQGAYAAPALLVRDWHFTGNCAP